MSAGRAGWIALLALLPLAAFAWWLGQPARGALPLDADVLYHVQRIDRCLGEWPKVASIDRYCHFGRDYRLHWPAGYTLLHATIARGLGLRGGERARLIERLEWLPPAVGAGALLGLLLLLRRLGVGPGLAALAGLAVAFGGQELYLFSRGALDYNAWTAASVVLLALAWVRRSLALWWATLLAAFNTTAVASPYVLVLLGAAYLCTAGASRPPDLRWWLAPAVASASAMGLNRLLDTAATPLPAFSVFHVSGLHVAGFAAAGLVLWGAARLAAGRVARVTLLAALVLLAAAAGLLQLAGELAPFLARLGQPRLYTSEEMSPLDGPFARWSPWIKVLLLALLPLALGLRRALREGAAGEERFARLLALAAALLGLLEWRNLRDLSPIVDAAVVVAAGEVYHASRRLGRPAWRATAAVVLAFLLVPAWADHTFEHFRGLRRREARQVRIVGEVADWLRSSTPDPGPRDGQPAWGVYAPWPVGHHLNVAASRPMVADPFNHVDMEEHVRAVWLARSAAELHAALRSRRARYLVVFDPGLLIFSLDPADTTLARRAEGVPGGLVWLAGAGRYAAFRLWTGAGRGAEFAAFRLRFAGAGEDAVAILDAAGRASVARVPTVQVYELDAAPDPDKDERRP